MSAKELSPKALETLAELGNFTPTVHPKDRSMKGWTHDGEFELCKTYWSADDMRRIAAGLIEAAGWLDARAESQP